MLKSLLSTFTRTQKAPTELRRYQMKFYLKERANHDIFCAFFKAQLANLKKLTSYFKFQSNFILAIRNKQATVSSFKVQ